MNQLSSNITSTIDMDWPWQYNFPPFFTLQTHTETRTRQLLAWKSLILSFCKLHRICVIDTDNISDCALFSNESINRTVQLDLLLTILADLQRSRNAAPIDKTKLRWEIYWHTLEEFASMLYDYISRTGQTNAVMTFYELTEEDDVADEHFYKVSPEILRKVLQVLENQGKCEIIPMDNSNGVKFF